MIKLTEARAADAGSATLGPLEYAPCPLSFGGGLYGTMLATAQLRLGAEGYGLSLAFGDLSEKEPIGEFGAGNGLRVCFLTAEQKRIQVLYDGIVLADCPLELRYSSTGLPVWHSLRVEFRMRAPAAGLAVAFDGTECVTGLAVERWAPQPGWRLGVGARSRADTPSDHWVRGLRLQVGARVHATSAPVALSFNGQQYQQSDVGFVYGAGEDADDAGS